VVVVVVGGGGWLKIVLGDESAVSVGKKRIY
jgi:hypothetical protein